MVHLCAEHAPTKHLVLPLQSQSNVHAATTGALAVSLSVTGNPASTKVSGSL